MLKSFLLPIVASARDDPLDGIGCQRDWCPVSRNVIKLTTIPKVVSFSSCVNACALDSSFQCTGFTWDDAGLNDCVLFKADGSATTTTVWSYYPEVNVTSLYPKFTHSILEKVNVASENECRSALIKNTMADYARFSYSSCAVPDDNPVDIGRGEYLPRSFPIVLSYDLPLDSTNATLLGSGQTTTYLSNLPGGLEMTPQIIPGASQWTWSLGMVYQSQGQSNVICLSNYQETVPPQSVLGVYVEWWHWHMITKESPCAINAIYNGGWALFSGSLKSKSFQSCLGKPQPVGLVYQGKTSQYGGVIPFQPGTKPQDGDCSGSGWKVEMGHHIVGSNVDAAEVTCTPASFDGDWIDGVTFPPGDFSPEWFSTLQIDASKKKFTAITKEGVPALSYDVSFVGCRVTINLAGSAVAGTLEAGGNKIVWDHGGFNNGDFWVRKNTGCCSLVQVQKPIVSLGVPDSTCGDDFNGRWVDRDAGDFMFGWVSYMDLSLGSLPEELGSNGRMTAPTAQGSWTLPADFYQEGVDCKIKLCTTTPCQALATATGTLVGDSIEWDAGLNHGIWQRQTPSDTCRLGAGLYACCFVGDTVGCGRAPNREVCVNASGQFCCDPEDASDDCGNDPTDTYTHQFAEPRTSHLMV